MATVVNKTTFEVKYSANTPDYPSKDWIALLLSRDNSDYDDLVKRGVLAKYWKIVSDRLVEMTALEKTTKDAELATAANLAAQANLAAAQVDANATVTNGKTLPSVAPALSTVEERIRAVELKTYGA